MSACVFVPDDPCFSGWTEADGSYTIQGIPPGDYRLGSGGQDGWVIELYDDTQDYGSATPVAVVAGVDLVGYDFTLEIGP